MAQKTQRSKVFTTCPGRIYEKLRKQFRNTQRVPFMLDKTQKPLFPNWEQKKTFFKENFVFFSFGKGRIVPKNVKGGTLLDLLTYILWRNIKNVPLGTLKNFIAQCRKKIEKSKGGTL